MIRRHFAYFRRDSGECLRESFIPIRSTWLLSLGQSFGWKWPQNLWGRLVSQPQRGEVSLDVTQYGYPLGDFKWATFDEVDQRLSFDTTRYFVEVDLSTLSIVSNHASGRPLRAASPTRAIVDITDTPLKRVWGRFFGRFVYKDHRWAFEPSEKLALSTRRELLESSPESLMLCG